VSLIDRHRRSCQTITVMHVGDYFPDLTAPAEVWLRERLLKLAFVKSRLSAGWQVLPLHGAGRQAAPTNGAAGARVSARHGADALARCQGRIPARNPFCPWR